MRRSVLAVSALLILALSVLLPMALSAPKRQLRIITPHWEGIRYEYKLAFEKWYKEKFGEEVEVIFDAPGGTGVCVRAIEDWFKTHKESQWDIFWGGGVDPYIKLKEEGLLTPFRPEEDPELAEILAKIPDNIGGIPMYDKDDYMWFGTALSGFGIIYNKEALKRFKLPEPAAWEDLVDPRMFGWVSSADPSRSGSTHMCYEIMLQAYGWERGWEIITLMGANIRSFPEHSSAIPEMVAAGEALYGLAIDFYAWSQIAKVGAERIGYVLPEGLTVINPDSIAILKNPPDLELAKIFVKFVLSEKGQKLWMLPAGDPEGPVKYTLGRMCVIPELYDKLAGRSIVPLNPFKVKAVLKYDPEKGSKRWSLVNDMFHALIIDTHDKLVAAWKKLVDSYGKVPMEVFLKAYIELTKVPVTEDEALAMAENWKDPEFRNKMISEWRSFAEAKYSKVLEILGG